MRVQLPAAAVTAAESAESKLGHDTVVLGMSELLGVVDAFVITSAPNTRASTDESCRLMQKS